MPNGIPKSDSPVPSSHLQGFTQVLEEPPAALVERARAVRENHTDYSTGTLLTTLYALEAGTALSDEAATNLEAVVDTIRRSRNGEARAALALIQHRFSPYLLPHNLTPEDASLQELLFNSEPVSELLSAEDFQQRLWPMTGRYTLTDLIAEARGVSDRFDMPWGAKVLMNRFELPDPLQGERCFRANGLNWCLFSRTVSIPWLAAMYGLLHALGIPCMQPQFFAPNIHTNRTTHEGDDIFRSGVALDISRGWMRLEKLKHRLQAGGISISAQKAEQIVFALKRLSYKIRRNGLCAKGWDLAVNIGDSSTEELVRIIHPGQIAIINARSAFRCFNYPQESYNPEPDPTKFSARGPHIPDLALIRLGLLTQQSFRKPEALLQEVVTNLLDIAKLPSLHSDQYAEALTYHFFTMLTHYENYAAHLADYTTGDEKQYWEKHTNQQHTIQVDPAAVTAIFSEYLTRFRTDGLVYFAALVLPALLRDLSNNISHTRGVLQTLYTQLETTADRNSDTPGGNSDFWEQWWLNSRKFPGSPGESGGGGSSTPPALAFGLGCGFASALGSGGHLAAPPAAISSFGGNRFAAALPFHGALGMMGTAAPSYQAARATLPPTLTVPFPSLF